jgi:hypothetical protein
MGHPEDEDHICSALVHMCGKVCIDIKYSSAGFSLRSCESSSPVPFKGSRCQVGRSIPARSVVVFLGRYIILYSTVSANWRYFYSDQDHETHSCDTRLCPSTCELCKRLCDEPHLHGLTQGTYHLCGSVPSPLLSVTVTEHRDE